MDDESFGLEISDFLIETGSIFDKPLEKIVLNISLVILIQSIVNALHIYQILIILPLMNNRAPAVAQVFFNVLQQVIGFDVYNFGPWLNQVLNLKATKPPSL